MKFLKVKIIWRLLLLFEIYTILSATLLRRSAFVGDHLNLYPFWTLRYAWINHSWLHWYNIAGNMLLFLPLGFLLPAAFTLFKQMRRVLLAGLALSVLVEIIQYVTHLGLCELDDMINNTYGTLLGYGIWLMYNRNLDSKNKTVAAGFVLGTVSIFSILILWSLAG